MSRLGPPQTHLTDSRVFNCLLGLPIRFVEAMIRVPVQVIVAARQIKVRLLAWNAYQQVFLRLASTVERPLLC